MSFRMIAQSLACFLVFSGIALPTVNALGSDPHLAINPVYQQLIEEGVTADGDAYKLPLPVLAERSDSAAQEAAIEHVVPERMRRRFFRPSVVADHVIKLDNQPRADGSKFRVAHFWFAAKANLDDVDQDRFLDSMTEEPRDEEQGTGEVLTPEDLEKRGIKIEHNDEEVPNENYGYGKQRLLKKVDIRGTSRSYWSQNEDSAVAAMILDPRFVDDKEFPNEWRKLTRDEAGNLIPGDPQPFDGYGAYVKITKLNQPEGFIFVEGHVVFVEPHAWFNGANLLGSKMPAILQTEIRRVRKALLKAAATSEKNAKSVSGLTR